MTAVSSGRKILDFSMNNAVWILLILAIGIMGLFRPSFFSVGILSNILVQATVLGLLAIAISMVILLGDINLSTVGTAGFSALTGVIAMKSGLPVPLSILVILIILLRSVLAPVLLILTTVLSFGTALGTAALVFNYVLDLPGADPSVPLYGFVFLVALGIDYNIFLMTRVREETIKHGTHAGITRGLAITGGVITSAGLVLAATFAALAVIPILFLLQLAFIVAFGVLLDTIVVRTILVPALAHDIGRTIWWPSQLAKAAQ